jgi:hypothetical protein
MVTIVTVSMLAIIVIRSNNITRRQNHNLNNIRINLNLRRNNSVGIEPETAESTVVSDIEIYNCEEKRGPELV